MTLIDQLFPLPSNKDSGDKQSSDDKQSGKKSSDDESSDKPQDKKPAKDDKTKQMPPGVPSDAQLVQLEKLGVLNEEGILTDEEFKAKKKQILGL